MTRLGNQRDHRPCKWRITSQWDFSWIAEHVQCQVDQHKSCRMISCAISVTWGCVGEKGQTLTSCVCVEAQGTEVQLLSLCLLEGALLLVACVHLSLTVKALRNRNHWPCLRTKGSASEEHWNILFKWNDFLYYFEKHRAFTIIFVRKSFGVFFFNSFSNKSLKHVYFLIFSSIFDKRLRGWWKGHTRHN